MSLQGGRLTRNALRQYPATMTKPIATAVFGLMVLLIGSCGGDDGAPAARTCAPFEACGGAVQTGSYEITGSCMTAKQMFQFERLPNCTTATLELVDHEASGTLALNADMTYTRTLTTKATSEVSIPSACLNISGFQIACSTVDMMVQDEVMKPGSPFERISCKGNDVCVCTVVTRETTATKAGTWAVAAGTLMLTSPGDPAPEALEYCAERSKLKLNLGESFAARGSTLGDLQIRGSLTLTKR